MDSRNQKANGQVTICSRGCLCRCAGCCPSTLIAGGILETGSFFTDHSTRLQTCCFVLQWSSQSFVCVGHNSCTSQARKCTCSPLVLPHPTTPSASRPSNNRAITCGNLCILMTSAAGRQWRSSRMIAPLCRTFTLL
jgi:hypothetical protein